MSATTAMVRCLRGMNLGAWMAWFVVAASLPGCGPKAAPSAGAIASIAPTVQISELQRRQRAACAALGPKLTQCAVADARASMSPADLAKLDIAHTAPKHTEVFIDECNAEQYSSRQVRVLEVCFREETDCELLTECLANVKPATPPVAP